MGDRKGKARQVLVAWLLTGGRSVEDWQEPRTTDWRFGALSSPRFSTLNCSPPLSRYPGGGASEAQSCAVTSQSGRRGTDP